MDYQQDSNNKQDKNKYEDLEEIVNCKLYAAKEDNNSQQAEEKENPLTQLGTWLKSTLRSYFQNDNEKSLQLLDADNQTSFKELNEKFKHKVENETDETKQKQYNKAFYCVIKQKNVNYLQSLNFFELDERAPISEIERIKRLQYDINLCPKEIQKIYQKRKQESDNHYKIIVQYLEDFSPQ